MTRAIVLAGSLNNGALKECSSASTEAFIKIGKKYMVEYVVEALEEAEEVGQIVISGPKKELLDLFKEKRRLCIVEGGPTIIKSLLNALENLDVKDESRILIVTSDIPLITGSIIDDFLKRCSGEEGDVIYPIISKSLNQIKFPGVERTYVKLRDGIYTGGNIFLVNPRIIKPCALKAEEVVMLRKSPLKLANYIGFKYLFKYVFGRLSLKDAEERVFQLFNIKGKAIPISFPEIGVDVDKPSDLKLVESILIGYEENSNCG
ncbi:MAG: NTP transferase domain-containing protein [Clostridia bacterium]|nr:NTP transferase domain-containing protein [Clostridia bacterium]